MKIYTVVAVSKKNKSLVDIGATFKSIQSALDHMTYLNNELKAEQPRASFEYWVRTSILND
jgi:hypothetical protein